MGKLALLKDAPKLLSNKSTVVLTAVSCIGVVATALYSSRSALKAEKVLAQIDRDELDTLPAQKQVSIIVKAVVPAYIPTLLVGGATIAAMVTTHKISAKQAALFATAYSISEKSFDTYRNKVIEKFGEKKHQEVLSDICEDEIYNNPVSDTRVIQTGSGNTLCYDCQSGRYFLSSNDSIRQAQVAITKALPYGEIQLNEFYERLGLDPVEMGDQLGWDADRKYPDIHFDSILADDGTPCLVLKYDVVILSHYLVW